MRPLLLLRQLRRPFSHTTSTTSNPQQSLNKIYIFDPSQTKLTPSSPSIQPIPPPPSIPKPALKKQTKLPPTLTKKWTQTTDTQLIRLTKQHKFDWNNISIGMNSFREAMVREAVVENLVEEADVLNGTAIGYAPQECTRRFRFLLSNRTVDTIAEELWGEK